MSGNWIFSDGGNVDDWVDESTLRPDNVASGSWQWLIGEGLNRASRRSLALQIDGNRDGPSSDIDINLSLRTIRGQDAEAWSGDDLS